jgi:hypothetical protein
MQFVAKQLAVAGFVIVALSASSARAQGFGYSQPVQPGVWSGYPQQGTFGQTVGYPGPVNYPQPMPVPFGPSGPGGPGMPSGPGMPISQPSMTLNWTGNISGSPYQLNVQPGRASLTWTGGFSGRNYRLDFSR